jgi:Tfp pilus assembly protein PilX
MQPAQLEQAGYPSGERDRPARRLRGERGQAYVLALVVLFTFTGAAAIWLARDVNQRVSDRSAIQSIAFQAARAGAQQIDVATVRGGSHGVVIDERAARSAAVDTARRLSAEYELDTQIVSQGYEGGRTDTWAVTVAIPDGRGEVTSADLDEVMWVTGIAHAETGG